MDLLKTQVKSRGWCVRYNNRLSIEGCVAPLLRLLSLDELLADLDKLSGALTVACGKA